MTEIHNVPLPIDSTTRCCGRRIYELPEDDILTTRDDIVTCGKVDMTAVSDKGTPAQDDPWGADRTAAADGEALALANVKAAGRIRQLEAALGAEKRKRTEAESLSQKNSVDDGELLIRRFLDRVAEQGIPSTLYATFHDDYRDMLVRRLTHWAATANALLGEFYALPTAAIAERDRRYAQQDAEAEGMTIRQADVDPVDDEDREAVQDFLNNLFEDDEDDE